MAKISRVTVKNRSVIIRLDGGKKITIRGREGVTCEVKNSSVKPAHMQGVEFEMLYIERNISQQVFGGNTVIGGIERLDINHPDSENFMGVNFKVAASLEVASQGETLIEILEQD
tara:strand:- start:539 stop:883 length:345 start_codon:yes stop_codon:yes gene_type:complete